MEGAGAGSWAARAGPLVSLALAVGSVALQSPSRAGGYKLCVASALRPVSLWHIGTVRQ